jgi:dephospho-CoA kinase
LTVGLTGGYCAGKSSAAAALRGMGWTVIDVDALGHEALARSAGAVAELLGPGALKSDGAPDRRAIGALVFADPSLLARYEAVIHPTMNALTAEAVAGAGDRACVDAAILYRLPIAAACDAIIEVRAPLPSRIARGMSRDGLGIMAILKRVARQRPLGVAGKAYADKTIIVRNHGGKARLEREIRSAVERIASSLGLN